MATRIFLAFTVLVWLPYGLYCLFRPESLSDAAGVAYHTATGSTEIRAMYGGLEAALGVLAGLALLRAGLVRPALVAIGTLTAGLASARLLGLAIDGGFSSYTAFALGLEASSAAIAFGLLRRSAGDPAALRPSRST
jgi:hypothetical protein